MARNPRAPLPYPEARQKNGVAFSVPEAPFEKLDIGRCLVDDFAKAVPWVGVCQPADNQEAVRQLRLMIRVAGHSAQEAAASENSEAEAHATAKSHLKALQDVQILCRQIAGRDVSPFQQFFALPEVPEEEGDDGNEQPDAWDAAGLELAEVGRLAARLARTIADVTARRPLQPAPNRTSAYPLLDRFLWEMHLSWQANTYSNAPNTRQYAMLVAAAWTVLEFPDLGDDPVGRIMAKWKKSPDRTPENSARKI